MVLLAYRSVWIVYALIYHVSLLWQLARRNHPLVQIRDNRGVRGWIILPIQTLDTLVYLCRVRDIIQLFWTLLQNDLSLIAQI